MTRILQRIRDYVCVYEGAEVEKIPSFMYPHFQMPMEPVEVALR